MGMGAYDEDEQQDQSVEINEEDQEDMDLKRADGNVNMEHPDDVSELLENYNS